MLTQTRVREYQKKISEGYKTKNMNIRRVCAAHKKNILLKAVSLWTGKLFWCLREWKAKKERKSPTRRESVQKQKWE